MCGNTGESNPRNNGTENTGVSPAWLGADWGELNVILKVTKNGGETRNERAMNP